MGLKTYSLESAIEIAKDISLISVDSTLFRSLKNELQMLMLIEECDNQNSFVHVDTIVGNETRYQGYWKITDIDSFAPTDCIWFIDAEICIDSANSIYIVVWNGKDMSQNIGNEEYLFNMNQVDMQLRNCIVSKVKNPLEIQLYSHVWRMLADRIEDFTWYQVSDQIDNICHQVRDQIQVKR